MGYDTSYHILDPKAMDLCTAYVLGDASPGDLHPWLVHAVKMRKVRYRAKAWAIKAPEVGQLKRFVHTWGRPFITAGATPQEVAEHVRQWLQATPETVDDLARQNLRAIWGDQPNVDELLAQADPGNDWLEGSVEELAPEVSNQLDRLRTAIIALRNGRGAEPAMGSEGKYSHRELLADANFLFLMDVVSHSPGWMSRGHTFASPLFGGGVFPLAATLQTSFEVDVTADDTIMGNYSVGMTLKPRELDALPTEVTDELVESFAQQLDDDHDYARQELTKLVESAATARLLGWGWCEATEVYSGFVGRIN